MPGMWKNMDAFKYAQKLRAKYGKPDVMNNYEAYWYQKGAFNEIRVKDESIAHSFPMPHSDFVYSTIELPLEPDTIGRLAAVTGSIIVDGLKGQVTARCGMLIKNAVTLGFAQDVAGDEITTDLKKEYSRRIKGNITPDWYKDEMREA